MDQMTDMYGYIYIYITKAIIAEQQTVSKWVIKERKKNKLQIKHNWRNYEQLSPIGAQKALNPTQKNLGP